MKKIVIKHPNVDSKKFQYYSGLCPFNAFYLNDNQQLEINENCKMCKQCVKKDQYGVLEYIETEDFYLDKTLYRGIYVFVEIYQNKIKDVSLELLSKAVELAKEQNESVNAVVLGKYEPFLLQEILKYKVNNLYLYEYRLLNDFNIEIYTDVFADLIHQKQPSIMMFGGTNLGRCLAPRIAARFKTGLTADCTKLEIVGGDLIQIRPAFGGNIMASIKTPNHRPQMCTVRSKIFAKAEKSLIIGEIHRMTIDENQLKLSTKIFPGLKQPISLENDISEAERIVVVGRIFNAKNLELAQRFAKILNCHLACTRPLVESGLFDSKKQIGLSGRTVSPKLLITLGVSGAIQFTAGLANVENIISINIDKDANIFALSNYCICGDVFKILTEFIQNYEKGTMTDVQKIAG